LRLLHERNLKRRLEVSIEFTALLLHGLGLPKNCWRRLLQLDASRVVSTLLWNNCATARLISPQST
jgi:hypothetical protein